MLQITPFETAERSPDGSPTPRWDMADENDLRTLKGIDGVVSMIFLKPRELRQMLVGILQSLHMMETDFKKQNPHLVNEIWEQEEMAGPEGPAATIF